MVIGEEPRAVPAVSGHLVTLPPGAQNDAGLPRLGQRATHHERGGLLRSMEYGWHEAPQKNLITLKHQRSLPNMTFVYILCADTLPAVLQSQWSEWVRGSRSSPRVGISSAGVNALSSESTLRGHPPLRPHQIPTSAGTCAPLDIFFFF